MRHCAYAGYKVFITEKGRIVMTAASLFFILAMVCMVGVVAVFFIGMVAMTRGRNQDHKISNKMMYLRVILQGGAILFLFLAYAAK